MTDDDIMRIERACTWLIVGYARAIDFRDQEAFLELFTADAVLELGETLRGHDAIRAFLGRRTDSLRTRHVVSNVFVHVLNEAEARAVSYLTLYRHDGDESRRFGPAPLEGPAAVGHYEDRFVHTDAGWRFASRRLQLAFRNFQGFPA